MLTEGIIQLGRWDADVLRRRANDVPREMFGRRLRKLGHRMQGIMRDAGGVGLAAPQIGLGLRFFVYDDNAGHRGALANPVITAVTAEMLCEPEGCLSVEGGKRDSWRPVWRYAKVRVSGLRPDGSPTELPGLGFFAQILQHEVDHLEGRLFLEVAAGGKA